ncbi:MAG: DUF3460 family protein [Burkholderiaceae bacterium]|nr:DUF3460 family protein [Burkholderiaceae bacterium]MEB2317735.1 DUF3460 family protein [Pseudomonadota bacterium]
MYESDITRFLRELKEERPHLEAEQQRGRAIWWDHPQDLETQKRNRESRLRQPSYVFYQINPDR